MTRPALRLRIVPRFPACIQGAEGVGVVRTGGVVTVKQDWSNIATEVGPFDQQAYEMLARDPATGLLVRAPLSAARAAHNRIITTAGPVTALASDGVIGINKTVPESTTVNLLPAATGNYITIKDVAENASSYNITIVPDGSDTIDGESSLVINIDGGSVGLQPTTGGWIVLTEFIGTGALPITRGGTGAATASGARSNLGLGNVATQNNGTWLEVSGASLNVSIPTNAIAYNQLEDLAGASLLGADGAGPVVPITIGTGLQFLGGVLSATSAAALWDNPRNRFVNPSMRHSQERGTTPVDCTTGVTVAIDQVRVVLSTTPGGTLRAQQVRGATPGGSGTYLRLTAQASDSSLAAGNYYGVDLPIEGNQISDALFGSASALPFVKRIAIRSSLAGTFGFCFQNGGATRSHVQTFAIGAGEVNTWVIRAFTIPGCVDGTWPTDTSLGARALLTLASGATFQGAAGSWQSSDVRTTSSQTNFMGTGSATFDIAELGSYVDHDGVGVAPPWVLPDFPGELAGCQRYWQWVVTTVRSNATDGNQIFGAAVAYPKEMRAMPTARGVSVDPGASESYSINIGSASIVNLSKLGATFQVNSVAAGDTFVGGYRASLNARF